MRCAVCGCNNNNIKNDKHMKENVSYYCFPKDPNLLKRWIHFCKRMDHINTKTARICSEHFESGDFERNLQYEMGFANYRRLLLKPGSVPSIYLSEIIDVAQANRNSRIKAREDKRAIDSMLKEVLEVEEVAPCIATDNVVDDTPIGCCHNCDMLRIQIKEHANQIQKMQIEIDSLKTNEEKLQAKLKSNHNEGVISDNANVSSDDTPDLIAPLTGTILKSISWEPEEEESLHQEQEELNSLAYDGLENLAGYICHKLPVQTLAQTTKNTDIDTNSWVSHVSEGGLLKPTPEMMKHMTSLEAVFTSFNGEDLVTCSKFLQNLLDLAEEINIDPKIKTLFFRARMFFRIRTLNRAITENAKSRKRKFNKILT